MAVRLPLLLLGVGAALLTAGCHALAGCNNTDAYAGAQNMPRLKIPAGLDGPDTSQAMEIPPFTATDAPRQDDKSCLEEPPPMREPGTITTITPASKADKPEKNRGRKGKRGRGSANPPR
jgi:uncharacterized lipoprotein